MKETSEGSGSKMSPRVPASSLLRLMPQKKKPQVASAHAVCSLAPSFEPADFAAVAAAVRHCLRNPDWRHCRDSLAEAREPKLRRDEEQKEKNANESGKENEPEWKREEKRTLEASSAAGESGRHLLTSSLQQRQLELEVIVAAAAVVVVSSSIRC